MAKPPSRVLLIVAGVLTQLTGTVCLVLALASLPVVHDLHHGMQSVLASVVAALAAIVCGTLVWRGRLVPLALATGVDVGFGIVLPRGGSAIGALLRILPADDAQLADSLVTIVAIVMFVAAVLCVIAIPAAVNLRRWAREEITRMQHGEEPTDFVRGTPPRTGPSKILPTQVINLPGAKSKSRWLVIVGVALTVSALGVIVIAAASGGGSADSAGGLQASGFRPKTGSGFGSATATATVAAPATATATGSAVAEPSLDDFVAHVHDTLGKGNAADVRALFDAKAFAFGVEGNELAEGAAAIAEMLRHDLGEPPKTGFEVSAKFHFVGREGDLAWLAEELRVGPKTYVVSAALALEGHAWSIAAFHLALAMPNADAYRGARDGSLSPPDAIPDNHDESPLATAMRTAFASKPSFVAARSARADAFNFGSAPGERIAGGDNIIKTFARIKAVVHLHDAVKVGAITDRAGWGAANVDFTDADRDGTQVKQTFRVLAIWVKEDGGWRIVSTQWSNPR